jgi:hypothetical protein
MPATFTARVTFSNGVAAEGVKVQMFDRDHPGNVDDELSITPAISDRGGVFTLHYDPINYLDGSKVTVTEPRNPPYDWTLETHTRVEPDRDDKYIPYLKFTFTNSEGEGFHTIDYKSGTRVYTLPVEARRRFVPSVHGWHFVNAFSGFFLPFSLPIIPGLTNPNSVYGLCGGMAAGALDLFLNNQTVPPTTAVPTNGSPIQRFLFKRQLDSMGLLGETILRFSDWMGLPDDTPHGTQKLTYGEFEKKIRPRLNKFIPTPIGLLYVKWQDSREIWLNHQVLAVRYERDTASRLRIFVYDPNFPNRDDIDIVAEKTDVGGGETGFQVEQRIGAGGTKKLYGFFAVPYTPTISPQDF